MLTFLILQIYVVKLLEVSVCVCECVYTRDYVAFISELRLFVIVLICLELSLNVYFYNFLCTLKYVSALITTYQIFLWKVML